MCYCSLSSRRVLWLCVLVFLGVLAPASAVAGESVMAAAAAAAVPGGGATVAGAAEAALGLFGGGGDGGVEGVGLKQPGIESGGEGRQFVSYGTTPHVSACDLPRVLTSKLTADRFDNVVGHVASMLAGEGKLSKAADKSAVCESPRLLAALTEARTLWGNLQHQPLPNMIDLVNKDRSGLKFLLALVGCLEHIVAESPTQGFKAKAQGAGRVVWLSWQVLRGDCVPAVALARFCHSCPVTC